MGAAPAELTSSSFMACDLDESGYFFSALAGLALAATFAFAARLPRIDCASGAAGSVKPFA